MQLDYLHNHKDFLELLNITGDENGILPALIEKDYWIMHVLYGLKKQGFNFELKGGTSLSKGYKIIDRFSEDIDLHIRPPEDQEVEENPAKIKDSQIKSRKDYYDWLKENIKIDGIISVERDLAFDEIRYYRSGGIRLIYESKTTAIQGVKEGILLEVGFDTVTPFRGLNISSWAYDKAIGTTGVEIPDNRAIDIACYHPGYTFVEKLQTIARKFRQFKSNGDLQPNLMRQYYDVYCLLNNDGVQQFIGTPEYERHKIVRFKKDLGIPIAKNEAFLLTDATIRDLFRKTYLSTSALYYKGQPPFDELLERIKINIDKL